MRRVVRVRVFAALVAGAIAALTGCEMGLKLAGIPLQESGVAAAMDYLTEHVAKPELKVAA